MFWAVSEPQEVSEGAGERESQCWWAEAAAPCSVLREVAQKWSPEPPVLGWRGGVTRGGRAVATPRSSCATV